MTYMQKYTLINTLKVCGLFILIIVLSGGCNTNEHRTKLRPNILFIVADDMGPWTLSINNDPNTFTPELDKLGKKGAVFSNFFASGAVCSPTRASLITGRYPSETGITDYIRQGDSIGVDLSLKMFPELLQEAGYSTILVGKWHLGEENDYHPTKRGYERFTGFPHGGMQSMSPRIQVEGKWEVAEGAYTPDLLADYTINYLNEFDPAKTGKPFLLSLHFWAPHANTDFPNGMEPTYEGRSWLPMQKKDLKHWQEKNIELPEPDFPNLNISLTERMAREYYSSVHSVDRNVGRVIEQLEKLGIAENTIVIFTSDHGFMMGHNGLWHKGSGRWLTSDGLDPFGIYGESRPNLYDNSIKVPCIIRWPKVIDENTKIEKTLSFPDFFPTILEMANIKKPDELLLRGNSFVPLLKQEEYKGNNNLYAEYINLRTFRTDKWKIVIDFSEKGLHELYNLKNDPREQLNLYNSEGEEITQIKEQLTQKVLKKMDEIKDPLLKQSNHL